MSEGEKIKRPEFVNDVRVKIPDDYDFNTWGSFKSTQAKTSRNITRISSLELMQFGKSNS